MALFFHIRHEFPSEMFLACPERSRMGHTIYEFLTRFVKVFVNFCEFLENFVHF